MLLSNLQDLIGALMSTATGVAYKNSFTCIYINIYHISPCSLGGHQVQLYLLTTSTYVNSGTNLLSSGVCDIQLHISKTKLVVNISAKLLLDKILLNQLIPRVIL